MTPIESQKKNGVTHLYTQRSMHPRTLQTKQSPKRYRCPLWIVGPTINTLMTSIDSHEHGVTGWRKGVMTGPILFEVAQFVRGHFQQIIIIRTVVVVAAAAVVRFAAGRAIQGRTSCGRRHIVCVLVCVCVLCVSLSRNFKNR